MFVTTQYALPSVYVLHISASFNSYSFLNHTPRLSDFVRSVQIFKDEFQRSFIAPVLALLTTGLIWFGLFVHPFRHTYNVGHVNYILQFIYYNTTYNIWTFT